MITVEKTLLEKISALPESLQIEVEHYVEFLLTKCPELSQSETEHPSNPTKKRDGFGILKGKIWMADDFDAPLEDMKEYM